MALQRFARAAFALVLIAIAALSLLPADDLPSLDVWDKLEHAAAYALLAAIGTVAWAPRPRARIGLALGLVAFGAVLEILQTFVPGRLGDFGDGVANAAGAFAGLAFVAAVGRVAGRASRLGRGW